MRQLRLFNIENKNELVTLKQASQWASDYLNKKITVSYISYLVQYGKIKKYGSNGNPLVNINELKQYYDSFDNEKDWKEKLGEDLNWHLSFTEYKESERTKHVHRLHPYKGKFIPQLVEYFLDSHTDEFKKEVWFRKGDIILVPFCGSGTTLVQANELGIHAIGIDISEFNSLISNVKVSKHNIQKIKDVINQLTIKLKEFQSTRNNIEFENRLLEELNKFNSVYFPSPEYKIKVRKGEINEVEYSSEKVKEFLPVYFKLVDKYNIKVKQDSDKTFLDKWFLYPVREEIDFMSKLIKEIDDQDVKNTISIIFSRTVRSCRATTHADLATLVEPVTTTYYCKKHGKICKPLFTILEWWERYSIDTISRLMEFDVIRTNTFQICITGDSRTINIIEEVKKYNSEFAKLVEREKIRGIFSSPPYVGLIDYHDQHSYAYEIFKFDRRDTLEIGNMSRGQSKEARELYIKDIAQSLLNCKKFLKNDYDIFLVANDKFNLYPTIAELSNMKIVNKFKRPVLNRVEINRMDAYSEIIFHLKDK